MKILIQRKVIENCPILEVVGEKDRAAQLPMVVYFHGLNNSKEKHLENAYGLAKEGFRVILPDALMHGERRHDFDRKVDPMATWDIVAQSLADLRAIHAHYEPLIDAGRFGIAGESMGGITACTALTQFPFISGAFIMMASPLPVQFTLEAMRLAKIDAETTEAVLKRLSLIDLSLNPEVLKDKPVAFWHDTDDAVMPYEPTKAWYEAIKGEAYANQVSFISSTGEGHRVRTKTIKTMIDFMKNAI